MLYFKVFIYIALLTHQMCSQPHCSRLAYDRTKWPSTVCEVQVWKGEAHVVDCILWGRPPFI